MTNKSKTKFSYTEHKGFFIDVVKKEITEIILAKTLSYTRTLGYDSLKTIKIKDGVWMYIDEEVSQKPKGEIKGSFIVKLATPFIILNNALVFDINSDGDNITPNISLDELLEIIEFPKN